MADRQENDLYPTPPELALAITQELSLWLPEPVTVIEPSAGKGSFVKAIKSVWPNALIVAIELDPSLKDLNYKAGADEVIINDWLTVINNTKLVHNVLILGNPPFSVAKAHIEGGIEALATDDYIAMLLRMSFMGSNKRAAFWKNNPARFLLPLVPRPNFMEGVIDPETGKKKGGDNSEYGMFVWQKGFRSHTQILPTLIWK